MSEPIILVKLHFSNGNSPIRVFWLSLFLAGPKFSINLAWNIEIFSCFVWLQTTSNKPQCCQTSEAVTPREVLELSEGEEQGRERLDLMHLLFFSQLVLSEFVYANFHQRKSVCAMGGCEFYITSLQPISNQSSFRVPQKKKKSNNTRP